MADRFFIVERKPLPPKQPYYDNEADAIAAFLAISKESPTPENLALVRVSERNSVVTQTDVEIAELPAGESPKITTLSERNAMP